MPRKYLETNARDRTCARVWGLGFGSAEWVGLGWAGVCECACVWSGDWVQGGASMVKVGVSTREPLLCPRVPVATPLRFDPRAVHQETGHLDHFARVAVAPLGQRVAAVVVRRDGILLAQHVVHLSVRPV